MRTPKEQDTVQKSNICIICRGEVKDLRERLPLFKGIADELIIITSGIDRNDSLRSLDLRIPMAFLSEGKEFQQLFLSSIRAAKSEWILIIESGEIVSLNSIIKLQELCHIHDVDAYYLNIKKRTRLDELCTYEWMANQGKYSTRIVKRYGYIPCLQIRLFRKSRFLSLEKYGKNSLLPILDVDTSSIPIVDFELIQQLAELSEDEAKRKDEQFEEDLKRYYGEYEERNDKYENYAFLVRDAIGYSMVDEKDMPSLIHALEIGFGNIDLLRDMVHSLIENGAYAKAIDFANTVSETIGDHIELWRLKGSAHFYMLNLEEAEKCFQKALTFNGDDTNLLSNLAKVYIISKKYRTAEELLNKVVANEGSTQEIEFILNSLKENNGWTVSLSLLILCKNEDKYLARALDSTKDIVDEMILVDTGSKDNTIDIALKYGATVVPYNWEYDFGIAKNEGLQHVTSDYVLCIDADEYLEVDDRISLLVFKHLLPAREKVGISMNIHTLTEENSENSKLPPKSIQKRTAIYPNLPDVCYTGKIFESIDDSLDRLGIHRIHANNIHICHQSENTDLRKERKIHSLKKCFYDTLNPETIFKGISFWVEIGDLEQGRSWLLRAVTEANRKKEHAQLICQLTRYFEQNGSIDIHSQVFSTLLSRYSHSYQIMTLCADMLCEAGEYRRAADVLKLLIDSGDRYFDDPPESADLRCNRFNFAMANLESGLYDRSDPDFSNLFTDKEMTDTGLALAFYLNLRRRDVDQAITILDTWIRERNLPIKGAINNFVDLMNIIVDVAECMIQYGQLWAGKVLARASEHLAASIGVEE